MKTYLPAHFFASAKRRSTRTPNLLIRFRYGTLLFTFLLLLTLRNALAQKPTENDVFYYYPPVGKVQLTPSSEKILVKFKSGKNLAQVQSILAKEPQIAPPKDQMYFAPLEVYILDLQNIQQFSEVKSLVGHLNADPEIDFAYPFVRWRQEKVLQAPYNQILLGLKQAGDLPLLNEQLAKLNLQIVKQNAFNPKLYHLALTDTSPGDVYDMANRLYETGLFAFAEPDFIKLNMIENLPMPMVAPPPPPNDPLYSTQWALNNTGNNTPPIVGTPDADMDVPEAWVTTTGSSTIKIAIIDTGVDLVHPDLAGNLLSGFDATGQNTNGGPLGTDANAHGTSCAGQVAAIGNNIGVIGIAYTSKIIPVRVFHNLSTTDSWLADGINWAWNTAGADVLSNSWGGGSPSTAIDDAIHGAVTNGRSGRGTVVLFSSGNDNSSVSYPAANPETIAVGAMSMCDERKNPASCDGENWWGGNYGTDLDVSAPGVIIQTTDISGAAGFEPGDYVGYFNGTSSACPNAAGVMALILSVNPSLTQLQARSILEGTCDKTGGYTYNQNVAGQPHGSWSNELGHGRVNAARAVAAAANPDDIDMDNYTVAQGDCNDFEASIHPNAVEICDLLDNNCDGAIDEGFDIDMDGYTVCNGDCNDNNANVNPGKPEICNGIDDNCDGVIDFPTLTAFASTDVPKTISESGTPTITSTLTISGATGNILDVNVKGLKIAHTWVGDLKATLTAPNGTVFTLFDRPGVPATTNGCSQNHILATFDDQATLTAAAFETTCITSTSTAVPPVSYAISGTYKPVTSLSALIGTNPNGTWTLTVSDAVSLDGGSLLEWSLEISTPTPTTTYYVDADGDTYGDPTNPVELACVPTAGFVLDNTDCDDHNASFYPGSAFSPPVSTVSPTTCGGTNGSISLSGFSPSTVYSVAYTKGSPVPAANFTSNAAGTIILTNLSAGSYTNIVVTKGSCSSVAVSATLSDPPQPTLTLGTIPAICTGAMSFTIPYTSSTQSPTTYSISGTGIQTVTDGALAAAPSSITVNLSSGATAPSMSFLLTVKNANNCVSSNITGSVTVNPVPVLTFTGPNPVCLGSPTSVSSNLPGTWVSNDPSKATIHPTTGAITTLMTGSVTFTFTVTGAGCQATTAPLVINPTPASALTASKVDVCPNTPVTLDAHCSIPGATINWNPGAPTVTPDAATIPYVYKASCTLNGCTGNESSVEVRTHRILVDMKAVGPGMLPQPLISAVKDNLAPANTITASPASRRWTFVATGCAASESAAFKLMGPVNFSSIDNGTPYALFANEGSNYYAIDHPNYGNGGSFPNGTYTLTVDLRSQDGAGGPFPKNRVATGALLATRTLQFTVANSAVREGVVEVSEADSEVWAQVSPNPVANTMLLTVNKAKGETVQVHLLDASGRTLLQHRFMPKTDQHQEVFDLSHITPGMYFLKVNTDRRNTTLKLIKSE